jgi:hypothetical protein
VGADLMPREPNKGSEDRTKFLLEMFKSVRTEIDTRIKAIDLIEFYAVGGVFAVVVFVFTNQEAHKLKNYFWIVILFLAAGFLKAMAHSARVFQLAKLARQIEAEFLGKQAETFGWESFLAKWRKDGVNTVLDVLFVGNMALWIVLFAAAFYFLGKA